MVLSEPRLDIAKFFTLGTAFFLESKLVFSRNLLSINKSWLLRSKSSWQSSSIEQIPLNVVTNATSEI